MVRSESADPVDGTGGLMNEEQGTEKWIYSRFPVPHSCGQKPVLVSSQLDRGSEPPSPAEGLARIRSCRSRTCQPGFVDPALEAARQPSSTPCQSRTGQPAFGGPVLGAARQGVSTRVRAAQ